MNATSSWLSYHTYLLKIIIIDDINSHFMQYEIIWIHFGICAIDFCCNSWSTFYYGLAQFSTVRKNMQLQSKQQICSRIMDARLKLENTEISTKMAKESPIFAERFAVVDTPYEYYTIVEFLDLF